jgi:hypothetical protein
MMNDSTATSPLRLRLPFERCANAVRFTVGLLIIASAPLTASAEKMQWVGTLQLDFGRYSPVAFAGSGVATINSSATGPQLEDLRVAGGITGIETIPITDPNITATFRSLRISAQLGTGTLASFWPVKPWPHPQLSRNTIPTRGSLRVCMFTPGCLLGIQAPFSRHSGNEAVGVGGILTGGGSGDLRISVEAAPWTVYSSTLFIPTNQGGSAPWTRSGWIHGPASYSSSAATTNGSVQLVSPLVVRSNGGLYLPGFASLTLRFIPEPGYLLLITAGIVALITLGRSRARS